MLKPCISAFQNRSHIVNPRGTAEVISFLTGCHQQYLHSPLHLMRVPSPAKIQQMQLLQHPAPTIRQLTVFHTVQNLTLAAAACANIPNFTAAFIASFQLVTMHAWNQADPNLTILQGDVYIPTTNVLAYFANTASCHRLRFILQSNAVHVASIIKTPHLQLMDLVVLMPTPAVR